MLEKYPNLWVLGVPIYVPILVLLHVIIMSIGFIYPLNPLPDFFRYKDFFENISITMILPTILLVVIFVIRQVKFNSKRVHLSLPYRYQFLVFLYFFGLLFGITSLPLSGNLAAYVKTNLTLDKDRFDKEHDVMADGFTHFFLEKSYIDDPEDCRIAEKQGYYFDDYNDRIGYTRYELNETKDSLIVYRHFVDYRYGSDLDTISLPQAYKEIETFISIAQRYEGGVTETDPVRIVEQNLKSDRFYTKGEKRVRPAFDYLESYQRFDNNINFHNKLLYKNSFFFAAEWEFWRAYAFLALALSILLIILCSVNIAEFGWGMLVVALHPTVFGIVAALTVFIFRDVNGDQGPWIGIILLSIFTLNALFFAFNKRFKPALRRAFAIACHIYLPLVAGGFMMLVEEVLDCCYVDSTYIENCDCFYPFTQTQYELTLMGTFFFGSILVTYLFGRYYKRQYTDPQIK